MLAIRFAVLFFALLIDRFVGDPDWLWSRVPHPIAYFGRAIGLADGKLNLETRSAAFRKAAGLLSILVLVVASGIVGWLISDVLGVFSLAGLLVEAVLVSVLLAQKSLADHVGKVEQELSTNGLPGGREAVSMIVGRDPETLNVSGVCRAAIESLAENFSDGVVAPAFWYVLLGVPGLAAYKMVNTADSMIGHKNEKYLHFGWASARLDDLLNYLPARLSVVFVGLGAWVSKGRKAALRAFCVALQDHAHHRSPNSGWPEAAMAGALNVQLAGPRVYGGAVVDEPVLNAAGAETSGISDIGKAIDVFYAACSWLTVACALGILVGMA